MADIINYNELVAQVYKAVTAQNKMATSLVGLDTMWCRLLPYDNGEDIIVQEYTLHQYECPKKLKVVTSKTDYQAGNYSIDLWGLHQELPMEINIDLGEWESVYGKDTMPQKGDFVFISMVNKPYEVKSSVVVYTIGEQATSYKCVLGQWQHNANRKETEDFTLTIDDVTVSQKSLFGKAISEEVADAIMGQETLYKTSTRVDPIKKCDLDIIVLDSSLTGSNGNVFSDAYYDFTISKSDVQYDIAASYDAEGNTDHWIYSSWFRLLSSSKRAERLQFTELYLAEKDWQWFSIQTPLNIKVGDQVLMSRGNMIQLRGVVDTDECGEHFVVKIDSGDCLATNKKIPNWWKSGSWKISKYESFNIMTAYNGDEDVFSIGTDGKVIDFHWGSDDKMVELPKGIEKDVWHYIMVDISNHDVRILVNRMKDGKDMVIADTTMNNDMDSISFDRMSVGSMYSSIHICKVRLYENEYEMEENYKMDMYSKTTHNASKILVVDAPSPANKQTYVTAVR